MKHVVLTMEDGTTSAVPVNDLSTVNVKTWAPPNASEGLTLPQMVDDQTFSFKGVVAVSLEDDAPPQAVVLPPPEERVLTVETLTDEQAAALDAPWEEVA